MFGVQECLALTGRWDGNSFVFQWNKLVALQCRVFQTEIFLGEESQLSIWPRTLPATLVALDTVDQKQRLGCIWMIS